MTEFNQPLIAFAVPGTYDFEKLKQSDKIQYELFPDNAMSTPSEYIKALKSKLARGTGGTVILCDLKLENMREARNNGLDFIGVYPPPNSCDTIQDVLDEMGAEEWVVCDVIKRWYTDIYPLKSKQFTKGFVVLHEREFLSDKHIEKLLRIMRKESTK